MMDNRENTINEIIVESEKIRNMFSNDNFMNLPTLSGREFEEWKAKIKGLLVNLKQNYLTESILSLTDGFKGWNDKKDFERLTAELKTLQMNFDEYIEKTSIYSLGFKFEKFCIDLFSKYSVEVIRSKQTNDRGYDFTVEKDGTLYYTELKFYRSSNVTSLGIEKLVNQMKTELKLKDKGRGLLIVTTNVDDKLKELFSKEMCVDILDISNLMFLVMRDTLLNRTLESLLNETNFDWKTSLVKENRNVNKLFDNYKIVSDIDDVFYNDFEKRLVEMKPGRNNFKQYEKLCTEILFYLFEDYLAGWKEQNSTVDGLNRMDLICRIKRGNEFWDFIKEEMNSRYLVFEFKNYTDEIKQTQVYTTEKYLFSKALRNVSFMISRKGLSKNAIIATEGILRESGKLIMSLSDIDLLNMIRLKKQDLFPEDYLFEVLDNIMMRLAK